MKIRKKRHRGAEVSTHALNDIMFFLLLFFIILSTMAVKYTTIKISVPSTKTPPDNVKKKDDKLMLDVDANKDYYINNKPVKFEDLERVFLDAKTKNPDIMIELSIDKELTVQDLVDVMELGAKMDIKMYLNTLKSN